jgi:hypothetical protein
MRGACMRLRRILLCIIFFSLSAASVFCTSLSIQIVQVQPGQDKICQTSQLFEQSVIDFFFESGHIVSNSPIYISTTGEKDEADLHQAIYDASAGYLSYFVSIAIQYAPAESVNPDMPRLADIKSVSWKTYSVASGQELAEGTMVPGAVTADTDNENGIISFAGLAAAKISAGLMPTGR